VSGGESVRSGVLGGGKKRSKEKVGPGIGEGYEELGRGVRTDIGGKEGGRQERKRGLEASRSVCGSERWKGGGRMRGRRGR